MSEKSSDNLTAPNLENAATGGGMLGLAKPFLNFSKRLAANPMSVVRAPVDLGSAYARLGAYALSRGIGLKTQPIAAPSSTDRRFKDAGWSDSLLFDVIKQSYLLSADWLQKFVSNVDGFEGKDAAQMRFLAEQICNAAAPSNFPLTNPEVVRATIETNGENLRKGWQNLLDDFSMEDGMLRISMTDADAFEVGKNVATAPGKVVFQNKLLQLLQFSPSTDTVYKKPLVIFPPWINKYYILDLRPENSLIRWLVGQGYTLFVASWVNPDESHAETTFEDYMTHGMLEALDAIEQATGEKSINVVGYCIGGTLVASALAYMAHKKDTRVASATFLTTQVDFSEPGDLGVFVDDAQLDMLEKRMDKKGYLDGKDMATSFNMLRSNDLIWSFFVNNYLLGKKPRAFDLLYWNSDATRMPKAMHVFYLRNMYLHNRLVEPGGIELDGVPIDLGEVEIPIYLQSSVDDHIAPYPSVYKATQLYSGPVRFMLAGSGHIAGVVNPPSANKYYYMTNDAVPGTVDEWIEGATRADGSWWPDWHKWLRVRSGKKVPARVPGDGALPALEDAPGSYVKG